MGHICLTYKQVSERYPEQVKTVMDKLRKGKSKQKSAKPEDLSWEINWGERIECMSLGDMLDGKQAAPPPEDFSNVFASIHGSIGKFWADGGSIPVPEEIKKLKRDTKAHEENEKAVFAAKTPQQQLEERTKLINEFLKGGGMVLTIPRR